MPAGIKEAFKSPFHNSNPSCQFHDLNSFTKSSATDSIRNEYYQANMSKTDFNTNYDLGHVRHNKLPKYSPSLRYPTLHPLGDASNVINTANNDDDSENSLLKDPHQGAGWIENREPCYSKEDIKPEQTNCDDLINQVLTNRYCRRILKKILNDNDNDDDKKKNQSMQSMPPFKGLIENFSNYAMGQNTLFNPETIKNIVIYCLGGLLILCFIELLVKFGQIIRK